MRSFYAGKPLPEGVDAAAKAIDQGTVRLVFLSGSDFVSDQTAMMAMRLDPRYGAGFQALHNIVDWLVQDTQLVGVRGKQVARPLEPIDDDKKLVLKLANLAGPPAGLAIFGLIYWQVRSRRRRRVAL